jgi:hypothetical protein
LWAPTRRGAAIARRPAGWAVSIGLALAVAACGGGDGKKASTGAAAGGAGAVTTTEQPGGGAAGTTDPCSLLTSEEVQGALGGALKPPKRNASPSGGAVQVCTWFPQGGSLPVRFVQVSVAEFPGAGRAVFDGGRRATPNAKAVSAVGDAAYSSKLGTGTKITFLKGETVISVTSVDEASATQLAKAVLARM